MYPSNTIALAIELTSSEHVGEDTESAAIEISQLIDALRDAQEHGKTHVIGSLSNYRGDRSMVKIGTGFYKLPDLLEDEPEESQS